MVNISVILSIAKREIRSFIDNPASYVVAGLFLLLWEFLFFLNAFLVGEASLRGLFDWLPWLSIMLIPALTMGSIAAEKNDGTLELVLTHPVKDLELILGKFVSAWVYVSLLFIFSIPVALSFNHFGGLDLGIVAGQIIGSILFAGAFISLGIFVSSLFFSQIGALLVSAACGFGFIIIGSEFITVNAPLFLVSTLERLSFLSHFQSLTRGVIDFRDLWYFGTVIIVFLSLAYLNLLARKYGNRQDLYRNFQVGVAIFVGIAILTNIIGSRIPGRIDLTSAKDYTLSSATQKIISGLGDVVTITLYASSKLPAQNAPLVRDTKDLLKDFQADGHGNIVLITKDPSENSQVVQEAQSAGIKEVQFNVIGQEEFQLKTGYLGLAISYADKHETIPFIEKTNDLEYQLSSIIRKLTNKNKKTVAFLSGNGEKSPFSEYQAFNTELAKQFNVTSSQIATATPEIATDAAALVVAGPNKKTDELTLKAISTFLQSGKNILFLVDSFSLAPQSSSITPQANTDNMSNFVNNFGVTVNKDIVYDLRSHETVRLGAGGVSFLLPYPFWIGALTTKEGNKISGNSKMVTLPWVSSLTLDSEILKKNNFTPTKLLTTSPYANVETSATNLSPDKYNFSDKNLNEKILAVALESPAQSGVESHGNIAVVGDSDFLSDQYMQSSDNLSFGLSLISWLTHDEALSGIKIRQGAPRKLVFRDAGEISLVKYGNMAGAIIFLVFIAAIRINRRRKLKLQKYEIV